MSDKDGKTEEATPKKLKDARKRGELAKSSDIVPSLSLFAFAMVFVPLWEYVVRMYIPYLTRSLQHLYLYQETMASLPKLPVQMLLMLGLLCLPFFAISIFIGLVGNFAQVGLLFSAKVIKPKFSKLNPISGFKNLFGMQSLVNTLKTLAKFSIVAYYCYIRTLAVLPEILNLSNVSTNQVFYFLLTFAKGLIQQIAIILVVLAAADYMYQRYSFKKKMRMSKQEIKEEHKQMEGDPQVKSQRKARYQAMLRNAVANVQEATVVVTNPTHYALAIRYEPTEDPVPKVLAKGADEIAQRMKEEAKKLDIPMIENKPVARALYAQVEPGDYIPIEMYEAIAEIIALVYQLEEEKKHKI